MYGDTGAMRRRAIELRTLSGETRARAARVRSGVGSQWVSTAAAKYIEALADRARDLETAATSLDEAATALDVHAREVDRVKQAIVEAEHWVTDRWNDAMHLAKNAVEVVEDGVGAAFHFFGKQVPDFLVHQAKDIVHSVPSLPSPHSHEWLSLSDTFRRQGW
jgi:hypothetical protein